MNINLHIERVVLEGISIEPHQQAEMKIAVESEIVSLLTSNGIGRCIQSRNSFHVVSGGLISIETHNKPFHIGHQIAGAIYQGIEK